MSECRSCGAPVTWATTENGKAIPLDPQPHHDGTFMLRPRTGGAGLQAVAVKAIDRPSVRRAHQLYRTHFATCPNATEHRRSR